MFPLTYNSFQNAPVEVEHRFDLQRIANYGYDLQEELRNAGWINFLHLDLMVIPGLVRQFMANAETRGDIIFSAVLNFPVRVDLLSIAKAIDCKNDGLPYYNDWINENPDVDSFLLDEDEPTGERVEVVTQMKAEPRLLYYLINKRFIQRDQDERQVSNLHKFCIYNILKNKEVNLPLLILDTIRHNLSNTHMIYYPIVLSKIMKDQGVMDFYNKMSSIELHGFGPDLHAKWFGVEQLRVLNFPIFSKAEAVELGITSYTDSEDADEDEDSAGDGELNSY